MGHTEKTFTKDIIYHLIRTRSCLAKLHYPVTHQISFTISKCSTQKLPSCVINYLKLPCRICGKNIHGNNKAVQCDLCELWIRIKCNNLNYFDYRYLQNCNESWSCIECCRIIFPFKTLSCNKCFLACSTSTDTNNIQ